MKASTRMKKAMEAAEAASKKAREGNTEKAPEIVQDEIVQNESVQPVDIGEIVEPEKTVESVKQEVRPEVPRALDFQHKYDVLKGKYNAEVKTVSEENKRIAENLEKLKEENQRLAAELSRQVDPLSEIEGLGEDVVEPIRKAGNEQVANATKTVLDALAQISEAQKISEQTAKMADRTRFFVELDTARKDWETIYKSPAYIEWESKTAEPVTGRLFADLMEDAANSNDYRRVLAILDSYKPKRSDISEQVVPAGTRGKGAPINQARIWTEQEADKFMNDIRRGKIRGDEMKRLSNDLTLAYKEGRVR